MLLEKPKGSVEQHDDADHDGILEVTNRTCQYGSTDQDQHQQALELVEEFQPGGTRWLFRQAVGAVFG
jgi:hypothetical protein